LTTYKSKIFFHSLEGLNNPPAQSAGELWPGLECIPG